MLHYMVQFSRSTQAIGFRGWVIETERRESREGVKCVLEIMEKNGAKEDMSIKDKGLGCLRLAR